MSKEDVIKYTLYIVDNETTLRDAANKFGVSKSTLHFNIHKQLKGSPLYLHYIAIAKRNFKNKSLNGGLAYKRKLEILKSISEV